MPTYDYRCEECGHTMAVFQQIKEDALKTCPECGKDRLRRLIGSGAGIIFRGSGFYETDYKRTRTSSKPSDDPKPEPKPAEKKGETKSDAKKPKD